jgi:hypothetical protein
MRLSLLALSSVLAGCSSFEWDTGTDEDSASDTGGMVDTPPPDRGTGAVNGTVSVQLYQAGTDDDITEISWADFGADFPFGAIYVAAYTVDETTNETTYWDEYVISAPTTSGDAYSLTIDVDDAETVYLYAALDWWQDGVIGTNEPIGLSGDLVAVVEGSETNDVDIVINAPVYPEGGGGGIGGGGGGGGGEGGDSDYVSLDGTATITEPYTGGGGRVMIYDSTGAGPLTSVAFTPTATADGAEGPFSLPAYAGWGDVRLLGAWDDDQNGLIDPTDQWGAYVVGDESANPLSVGTTSLTGLDVRIPFGLPPALSPFVRIEGALAYAADYSTLPAGSSVYVTALRTRPGPDFSVADLARGYDSQVFTGAELSGTSLDYLLVAPSNAIAYVWAYADLDGDGILNEAGELLGSTGRTGRIETGTSNSTGVDIQLSGLVVE